MGGLEYKGGFMFRVPGKALSKENYTRRSRKARGKKKDEAWERILKFQNDVGWACKMAGKEGGVLAVLYGRPLALEVEMVNQRIDLDNCKAIIDAMKGIAYPDDAQKYVRSITLNRSRESEPGAEPALIITVRTWE